MILFAHDEQREYDDQYNKRQADAQQHYCGEISPNTSVFAVNAFVLCPGRTLSR